MKRIHLFRVDGEAQVFSELIAASKIAGLKVGWLHWAPSSDPDAPSTQQELFRRVDVVAGRTLSEKPRSGAPIFRDVLREYFQGCVAVLVQVDGDLPSTEPLDFPWHGLTVEDGELRVEVPNTAEQDGESKVLKLNIDEMVKRLPRPRPFDD